MKLIPSHVNSLFMLIISFKYKKILKGTKDPQVVYMHIDKLYTYLYKSEINKLLNQKRIVNKKILTIIYQNDINK